jgi:flagella basal body P-ring formation protein FlgA
MSAWLVFLSLLPAPGSCQAIHADQITGEDLARALPAFSHIPRDTAIGNAPAPGSQRVFAWPELQRIGRPYGVDLPTRTKACFEWEMRTIDAGDVRDAIRESLHNDNARVDVLAIGKGLAPQGKLAFPLSGLSASTNVDPTTPVTWRGEVLYGSAHQFAVWVRVRVVVSVTRVVAQDLLLPGQVVTADRVKLETVDGFPLRNGLARSLGTVIGKAPLRAIREGSPIFDADLAQPIQVKRGESVLVTAVSGGAQLKMEAVAEGSGKQGDVISLRNPRSGKTFRARIEGHDQALVVAGPVAILSGVQ